MRIERSKDYALAHHIGICTAMLLIFNSAFGFSMNTAQSTEQQDNILETIRTSYDFQITIDNSGDPPLSIQAASAKEITGANYKLLTRINSASSNYISWPNIKLVNNTAKTVTTFYLGLFNKDSGVLEILGIKRRVDPFKELVVQPLDWALPRKSNVKKFILKEGVAHEDKSLPDLNSEVMWLPGHLTDFYVLVTQVEFEDGTKWTTKR